MSGRSNFTGLTPGAQRTLARCRRMAVGSAQPDPWAAYLVLTLLQDESLASACLVRLGITRQWLMKGELGLEVARSAAMDDEQDNGVFPGDGCQPVPSALDAINDPLEFTRVLDRATELARRGLSDSGVSSANLLLAVVETNTMVRERFAALGATPQRILAELYPDQGSPQPPLSVDASLVFSTDKSAGKSKIASEAINSEAIRTMDSPDVWRVLDANLNRAREGLRVLEDYSRFLANDDRTSLELKSLRHELVAAEKRLISTTRSADPSKATLSHRDTVGDVGTSQTTTGERWRDSLADVIVANCRRVQESLRSLEEFGKLVCGEFAASMKQLRYSAYTVEKLLGIVQSHGTVAINGGGADTTGATAALQSRNSRLQAASVYVLITESMCRLPWQQVVQESLAAGADVLQLREKAVNDRELLRRSRWICDACRAAGALFIMNDRPDLAAVSDADGVHVGQDELTVGEARRILQPGQLIGVSTHDRLQAIQAIRDGADYIGVGPVFPSQTKAFDTFPGLDLVRSVASSAAKPWFAIGGLSLDLLPDLIAAGCSRVAVTSAVVGSAQPGSVVREFKAQLITARTNRRIDAEDFTE